MTGLVKTCALVALIEQFNPKNRSLSFRGFHLLRFASQSMSTSLFLSRSNSGCRKEAFERVTILIHEASVSLHSEPKGLATDDEDPMTATEKRVALGALQSALAPSFRALLVWCFYSDFACMAS
jgi:hypothetical protein